MEREGRMNDAWRSGGQEVRREREILKDGFRNEFVCEKHGVRVSDE
jgi:hypothetical protein